MKMKIFLILMSSILLLQNCAPSKVTKTAAVASRDQKIGYEGTVTSKKKHFVSLAPYTDLKLAKDKTLFLLVIRNCGETPINISYDNVSVIFAGNSEKWASKRINIQQVDDFIKDLKEEYGNYEKKYIKSELESIKTDSESSSSAVSDSDSLKDEVADLKNKIVSMRAQNQLLQEGLPEFDMKSQTITPGDSSTGIVVCDTRDMTSEIEGDFQIVVTVDSEAHRFTFKRTLNK
jgi:hypothetical protein